MDNAGNYTSKIPSTQPKAPSKETKDKRAQLKKQQHARTLSNSPGMPGKKVSLRTPDKPVKTEAPLKTKKSESTEAKSSLNALFDILAQGEVLDSDITKQVQGCFATGAVDANLISAVLAERTTDDQTNIANAAARVMKSSDDSLIKRLMTAVHNVTKENLATQVKTAPAVEDLLLEVAKAKGNQTKASRLRELLLLANDQLRIGGEEISLRINAALEKLTPQQTIDVASCFIKLDPSDQGICLKLGHEISAATSRVAPKFFVDECLAYRSPPFGALEVMEKVEDSSVDLTEVNAIQMLDFLDSVFGQALDGLPPDQLKRLHDRLGEGKIPDVSVVSRFCRSVAKRVEKLNLLPQQPDLPKT